MTEPAFVIPKSAMLGFSNYTQAEIYAYFGMSMGGNGNTVVKIAPELSLSREAGEDGPVELTLALVRKLTDRLSEKTLNALRVIAASDTHQFHMKDIIDATEGAHNYMDLRGVWAALTRRTRNICDDSEAQLIWWAADGIYEGDEYVDQVGEISLLTHKSLRTFFNI